MGAIYIESAVLKSLRRRRREVEGVGAVMRVTCAFADQAEEMAGCFCYGEVDAIGRPINEIDPSNCRKVADICGDFRAAMTFPRSTAMYC